MGKPSVKTFSMAASEKPALLLATILPCKDGQSTNLFPVVNFGGVITYFVVYYKDGEGKCCNWNYRLL